MYCLTALYAEAAATRVHTNLCTKLFELLMKPLVGGNQAAAKDKHIERIEITLDARMMSSSKKINTHVEVEVTELFVDSSNYDTASSWSCDCRQLLV
jgi:hypothetical protein